jgi:hypothetical protein
MLASERMPVSLVRRRLKVSLLLLELATTRSLFFESCEACGRDAHGKPRELGQHGSSTYDLIAQDCRVSSGDGSLGKIRTEASRVQHVGRLWVGDKNIIVFSRNAI